MLCATQHRTECQSGYVNSRSSHLETCSLLPSQCDSKPHRSYRAFIPTCQQMRALYTCGNLRWCVYVCIHLGVPTEELAVQAYSQPAFLTSLMNLQRTATCQLSPVLSCLHCSFALFSTSFFSFLSPTSLFVCLNRRCLSHCGVFCLQQLTSFLYLLRVHILHIPIKSQGGKWSERDLAVVHDRDEMNFSHNDAD